MKHLVYILFLLSFCLSSCGQDAPQSAVADTPLPSPNESADYSLQTISPTTANATCSYFTRDHMGNPVLCWSESGTGKENYQLRYATFNAASQKFEEAITVGPSQGMQAKCESMAKVAFRPDGSVVAVFRFATPTKMNRYAGGLFYSQSFDQGASWTEKTRLVAPDVSSSQSFFDLVALENGEIAMVWLDGRRKSPQQKGSCLVYNETTGPSGFTQERILKTGVCQCCRTDFYKSEDTRLHIAYRDILNDSIRDMAYLVSSDDGQSFSNPTTIYDDGWVIDGCPHTGPSLAWNGDLLANAWYTQGGGEGIYFTTMKANGKTVGERELITSVGSHPQMVALEDARFAVAMEYFEQGDSNMQIVLYIRGENGEFERQTINQAQTEGKFPVLTRIKDGKLLIAWTLKADQTEQVVARVVNPQPLNL